jgi:long-chain acyl-CoA synthetase
MSQAWRLLYNPEGDAADILAYPSALAEGRIGGKYMLSKDQLPDTLIIQGVKRRGIIAGADVKIDKKAADKAAVDVALAPRSGRRGAQPVDTISLSELMAGASKKFDAEAVDPDDPAVILYTSGTTGKPKGVVLTHKNFYTQCDQVVRHIMPVDQKDIFVGVLPLYHVYGLSNGLITTIFYQAAFALVPHYSPANLLSVIDQHKASILIAIPSMYNHLLALARVRKTNIPKSLRICVSGGAPLPAAVLNEFQEVFETRINEGYGLTETTSSVSVNQFGENYRPGSIGPASHSVEMEVLDENGTPLPDGEEGEIVIRGDVVTPGYWNLPEETAATIRDGWLHTGDLGHRDADGYFYITDRKKDLIIRGGFNISPREVEEVLISHPAISDAAVIGAEDSRGREIVKAYVSLLEGQTVTERQLLEHCESNLAPYKLPKAIEFRDTIPKSATGKVLRKELRDGYRDERLIQQA